MFPWDQDAMHAPRPGVNMPFQDPDVDPFAERTDDDAKSNSDWQISSESEGMPNSDTALAIDAPIIEPSNETRASSSSLIDIARVIHASDYAPRTVPRRRLPRRTGGTPAEQVALRDGLRKWAGYDATNGGKSLPTCPCSSSQI